MAHVETGRMRDPKRGLTEPAVVRWALTAILLLVYLGYLALRRATVDPDKRAARASILGIIAATRWASAEASGVS